ncbi:hypothetical protein [Neorhizobium sp. JUb45]|uniref:hypothetical protein n=1 Tax=Neorhizobium sp. JUb45 TaxID=2485113 RepID=UPI00104ACCA7|nr:hypothetical protein [Neorhizobium sp. JUb45]TCQ99446.1 hypothetical protein EDF70_109152 [Neorhizobium sp. JUb45]
MKMSAFAVICTIVLGTTQAFALDAIPGSLIYKGQPVTRLQKAPVGSSFTHDFISSDGGDYEETYVIQSDRTVKLVSRIHRGDGH